MTEVERMTQTKATARRHRFAPDGRHFVHQQNSSKDKSLRQASRGEAAEKKIQHGGLRRVQNLASGHRHFAKTSAVAWFSVQLVLPAGDALRRVRVER